MNKKPKVKKTSKSVELSIGQNAPTKYDVMKLIAKKYSIYGSTVWLNNPLKEYGHQSPAQLMMNGEIETVYELIQKSDGKFDL